MKGGYTHKSGVKGKEGFLHFVAFAHLGVSEGMEESLPWAILFFMGETGHLIGPSIQEPAVHTLAV